MVRDGWLGYCLSWLPISDLSHGGQGLALVAQLGYACDLYNAALEEHRYARRAGRLIGYVTSAGS